MTKSLKKTYWAGAIPAIAMVFGISLMYHVGILKEPLIPSTWSVVITLFICSACSSIAFPILYRTYFAYRYRLNRHVTESRFFLYQRNTLIISLTTPYIALASIACGAREIHLFGPIFFSLYALYFYFPSDKKIASEMRLFRVKPNENN